MKKKYSLLALVITSLSLAQSNYLVENFNYTAGDLLTTHNWMEHSGAGTNVIETTAAGLTFTGYVGSNIGLAAGVDNTGSDINKAFDGAISTGSVYTSFLVKPGVIPYTDTNSNPYFFHYGTVSTAPNLNSAFRARTFILPGTDPTTQIKFALSFNSTSPATAEITADFDSNNTYLMVVKYTFNATTTSDDTASLYVFNVGDSFTTEPATPTIGPVTGSAADATLIDAIALRQYSANQNILVDAFYVRTVWDLVNPGVPLSTKSFDNKSFLIYPNPASQGLVNLDIEGVKDITIYDVNGRIVLQQSTSSNTLDVSQVKQGFYLVQLTTAGKTVTSKLIIE
ncbi:T9SS type A sorting domain-containing protein [uncultured Flavobacterium sp.]|uniref:T9SS type A sorting domain-containing protein n=1 Tax=uncultured Flavobacterium sp. TaxID=165435 RepID=UPI0030EE295C